MTILAFCKLKSMQSKKRHSRKISTTVSAKVSFYIIALLSYLVEDSFSYMSYVIKKSTLLQIWY